MRVGGDQLFGCLYSVEALFDQQERCANKWIINYLMGTTPFKNSVILIALDRSA
jgi:hypothetical protein